MTMTVNDTFVWTLMIGNQQHMDLASINYNNTVRLKYYNWNRLLAVGTKLLLFKNNNCIYVRQVCHSKPAGFQSM
jgi:hypothetical protein